MTYTTPTMNLVSPGAPVFGVLVEPSICPSSTTARVCASAVSTMFVHLRTGGNVSGTVKMGARAVQIDRKHLHVLARKHGLRGDQA